VTTRPGEPRDGTTRRPASTAAIALFLSLSLLLLAFFIVLNTLSTTEATRARAVMDSLDRTFSESDGRLSDGTAFTGAVGTVIGAHRTFEAELAEMVASAVPLARVRQSAASAETEVVLRADALFDRQGPALRRPRWALLDRLVAAVSAAPPGIALTMEFTLGTDYDSSRKGAEDAAARTALQRARAAGLAEALLARGLPPEAFAVGLDPLLGDQARLRFRTLDLAADGRDGRG
jgi:hypothetical protein